MNAACGIRLLGDGGIEMDNRLTEYARIIARIGANVQKGQTLVLACPVECADFGRMVASEAYGAGAREVVVRWTDDKLTRMRYLRADDTVFDEIPDWMKTFYYEYADKKAALVSILASDPELLSGVDPDRVRRSSMVSGNALKQFVEMQMRSDFQWCLASASAADWAAKVFPGVPGDDAVESLWDAILSAVRVTGDGRAEERWQQHVARLHGRAETLNKYRFAKLIYKNSLGTDLTVELPEKAIWVGAGDVARTGATFIANMPSEEIFTLPKKHGVNGTLCSSLPLSLDGVLVKDIRFTVIDGKIVDAAASEGLESLLMKLDLDEGARYLGEVALVPYDSPISNMGILFYNTLFDENASCHFAFGKAYPSFPDAAEITGEEMKARGMNDSITHIDFMVGTADLDIAGVTRYGQTVDVFKNGNFAF